MKEHILVSIDQKLLEESVVYALKKEISISALVESVMAKFLKFKKLSDFNGSIMRPPEQALDEYLKEIECDEINKAISSHETKAMAAESLGISFRSLRHRLKQFQIE